MAALGPVEARQKLGHAVHATGLRLTSSGLRRWRNPTRIRCANGATPAAGAVDTRKGGDVLVVHRPKCDDWSFPEGKLDPGEHVTAAAVSEVAEETGLDIRVGPPLGMQRYWVNNVERRLKRFYYWVGRVVGDVGGSSYRVDDEIDEVA
ncbi:MAG: NUDIX domain-containing protein [Nocardioidaceae bacterium]